MQCGIFLRIVISGDSANFSVGANLMQLLLSMQEEEWDEVELADQGVSEHDAGCKVLSATCRCRSVWECALAGASRLRFMVLRGRLMRSSTWGWWRRGWGCFPGVAGARSLR